VEECNGRIGSQGRDHVAKTNPLVPIAKPLPTPGRFSEIFGDQNTPLFASNHMLPAPPQSIPLLWQPYRFSIRLPAKKKVCLGDSGKRSNQKRLTHSPNGEIPVEYLSILTQSSESLYFGNMRNSVKSANSLLSGTCVDQEVQDVLD
jgi:hypothetical protein